MGVLHRTRRFPTSNLSCLSNTNLAAQKNNNTYRSTRPTPASVRGLPGNVRKGAITRGYMQAPLPCSEHQPSTMRAVLIKDGEGPIENLYIGDIERPLPGEGEVLVKIAAFGLNRMDLVQREGMYPPPPGASHVLGVEFSGIVHELGPGVTQWCFG
ncbi:chaperonin 10-like protein [Butyriboletus roseoflavus]|nr:chaperonin 10-like protein [Butyriboletus roseoflavus]